MVWGAADARAAPWYRGAVGETMHKVRRNGPDALPVLPLDVVVFPGMTVPVTATEERYKHLVKLALAQETEPKRFITVFTPPTAPIRDTAEQFERYGTLVHLLSVEETDEGYDLVLHGQERCEVDISDAMDVADGGGDTRPLYFAEYRPAPVVRGDPNAEAVAAWDAIDTFREYADTLYRGDTDIDVHLPEDPLYQASFVCANIRVPAASKQPLLAAPSLTERFDLARDIMRERMSKRRHRARRQRA